MLRNKLRRPPSRRDRRTISASPRNKNKIGSALRLFSLIEGANSCVIPLRKQIAKASPVFRCPNVATAAYLKYGCEEAGPQNRDEGELGERVKPLGEGGVTLSGPPSFSYGQAELGWPESHHAGVAASRGGP